MNSLKTALYTYASEHRILSARNQFDPERWHLEHEVTQSMNAIAALGEEGKRLSRRLEEQYNALSSIYEEAAFLAGLSIGLELGALGHG